MASVVAISLVGPPAAGKSSLVNSLRSLNCLVFRLREYAPVEALAATASTATGLGWISNDITASCLRSFVARVKVSLNTATLLFDNYPGTASQVSDYVGTLEEAYPNISLLVFTLDAPDSDLRERAKLRRTCANCEKDPLNDPRIPARASVRLGSNVCRECGHQLIKRAGDMPELFDARLRRYRLNSRQLATECHARHINMKGFDARLPVSNLVTQLTMTMREEMGRESNLPTKPHNS